MNIMLRIIVLAVFMQLATAANAQRQAPVKEWPAEKIPEKEATAVSDFYAIAGKPLLPTAPTVDFPDGAHGHEIIISRPRDVQFPNLGPVEQRKALVAQAVCSGGLIAVVQGVSASSFTVEDSGLVFTRYRLRLLNVLFDDAAERRNDFIVLTRIGGQVGLGKDIYRVSVNLAPPMELARTYVITARNPRTFGRGSYVSSAPEIEVLDGRVYPITGKWLGYESGTPLTRVMSDFDETSKKYPAICE